MKIFGIITLLFVVVVVVTHAENKYSSNQTDGCEKDSTQQHCLKKKDHQMEGVDDDDGEPEFYDEDDDGQKYFLKINTFFQIIITFFSFLGILSYFILK